MHRFVSRALFLPTFAWNYCLARVLRRRHWWDAVTPNLYLGALPLRRDVPQLADLGVRGVVNMCQEYRGPIREYEHYGIEQLWLPTVDFNPPSLADVKRGVQFIDQITSAGKKVYVHCKAGRARSATVVLCWLVHSQGMTPAEAQNRLLEVRPHVNPNIYQRSVVREYLVHTPKPISRY